MVHEVSGHTSIPLLSLCSNEGEVDVDGQRHKEEDGIGSDEGFECHAMTRFLQAQEQMTDPNDQYLGVVMRS